MADLSYPRADGGGRRGGVADAAAPVFLHAPLPGAAWDDVAALLGGRRVLGRAPTDALAAHGLILDGLPARALLHLLDAMTALRIDGALEAALGMSLRTIQRHKEAPGRPLSLDQGSRLWAFADILARAIAVFGTRDAAERWLTEPAIALDRRRPIDLLATPAGAGLVGDLLTRLDYGTYA